mgnify:CR=1 FL=1
MTSTISEDALRGQQSRIMAAMRAAQPRPGRDLRNIAQAATMDSSRQGNYFDIMNQLESSQAQTNVNAEKGIYDQMKEMAGRGDADAMAVNKAVDDIAGGDPAIATMLSESLHKDSQPINRLNATSMVMKHANNLGITPLSVQKERASLQKVKSDMAKAAAGGDDPAAVREYSYFKGLPEPEQKKYLGLKRSSPDEAFEKEKSRAMGKAEGGAEAELLDLEATMPEIETTVADLREIGKNMTYTKAGKIYDAYNRQLDREPRAAAVAREKYINTVRDQVFPLLRQTFGAQFTKAEGDALLITMGDPDKSPPEREAALDAFIAQKKRNIRSARRRVNKPVEDIPTGGKVNTGVIDYKEFF